MDFFTCGISKIAENGELSRDAKNIFPKSANLNSKIRF
jgi:hypothetical protein